MKKKMYAGIIIAFMMGLSNHYSYSQSFCLTQDINLSGEHTFNEYVTRFKARGGQRNTSLKIIPIVIHVIYRNNADKLQISWARILGQIDVTNKQLRRLNANANETRPMFKPVAADCNIQVMLATRKPDRSRFSGVLYHEYPNYDQRRDFDALRVATALDPNKYLNIWVIPDLANGEAVFPWQIDSFKDGFYIGAQIFGTRGSNLRPLQSGGATFTHELAHYLGVLHTFDRGSGYSGECARAYDGSISDYCADTPLDWQYHSGIQEECDYGKQECIDIEGGILISQTENYMFYNKDSCLNMFSKDQRARIRACLHGIRSELVSNRNLLFTGVKQFRFNDLTVDKPGFEKDITIFPNPANSIVHISYHGMAVKSMSIKIYNQIGINLKELHSSTAINELNIDSFPPGVYYITITSDNASVTKCIIKAGSGNRFPAK